MTHKSTGLITLLALLPQLACAPHHTHALRNQATVPLAVVGNRPFIDVAFKRTDGVTVTGRFLIDTGGGAFLITEQLARKIGAAWGATMREEGSEFGKITSALNATVGGFPLALVPARTAVVIGSTNFLPAAAPGHADGMLPGHVLAKYHVVFDYPRGRFTIAAPGVLKPLGAAMPMPVSKGQGFPRTEVVIDGVTRGFLIDTGASFTMVSETLLKALGDTHPTWPRHAGAFGEAATLGGQTLETMTVAGGTWGTHEIGEFGVTSQRAGTFERFMSGMMTSPIVGSLAGNVLKKYRVELDYQAQMIYVSGR